MKPKITSHTIVKNEDRYIWFVIQAALKFVDQMIIYDTGSTDNTVSIIKSIHSPKIIFETKGSQTATGITRLRQDQLDRTKTDWFLILDGDEVWWQSSLQSVVSQIQATPQLYGIITPTINCVGDIYHYQAANAGRYTFASHTGHYAVRAINRRIPGLHLKATYPLEGYYDNQDRLVTDYDSKLILVDKPFLHLTNLSRSTASEKQVISRQKKHELGIPFSQEFRFPEVFYQPQPDMVPSPWVKTNLLDTIIAAMLTPLKKIKRNLA